MVSQTRIPIKSSLINFSLANIREIKTRLKHVRRSINSSSWAFDTVHIFSLAESATRDRFGKVAIAAAEALIADEQQSSNSSRWWRQGWSDVQTYDDGITIDAQAFDT
jgi:hypothetical protein